MEIKVKYHNPNLIKFDEEDLFRGSWIDLRAAETVEMKAGEHRLISLGVSMELPEGHEAIIAPRSSLFKNYGLLCANSIGVIDYLYCGVNDIWKFSAYATRDTVVHENDRICQFRIQPEQSHFIHFVEVESLENDDRGGFGSTGKN